MPHSSVSSAPAPEPHRHDAAKQDGEAQAEPVVRHRAREREREAIERAGRAAAERAQASTRRPDFRHGPARPVSRARAARARDRRASPRRAAPGWPTARAVILADAKMKHAGREAPVLAPARRRGSAGSRDRNPPAPSRCKLASNPSTRSRSARATARLQVRTPSQRFGSSLRNGPSGSVISAARGD